MLLDGNGVGVRRRKTLDQLPEQTLVARAWELVDHVLIKSDAREISSRRVPRALLGLAGVRTSPDSTAHLCCGLAVQILESSAWPQQ